MRKEINNKIVIINIYAKMLKYQQFYQGIYLKTDPSWVNGKIIYFTSLFI